MNQTDRSRSEQGTVAGGRGLVAAAPGVALLPAADILLLDGPGTIVLTEMRERGAEDAWWATGVPGGGGELGDVVEDPWQRAEREQGAVYG